MTDIELRVWQENLHIIPVSDRGLRWLKENLYSSVVPLYTMDVEHLADMREIFREAGLEVREYEMGRT